MVKFEKLLLLFFAVGFGFKLLNLPFAGLLLFVSLCTLSLFYLCLGFAFFNNRKLKEIYKPEGLKITKPHRMILSIGFGWGLSILIIGILFRILNYPMQSLFIKTGIVFSLLVLIVLLLADKEGFKSKSRILYRAIVFIMLGIILLFLPPYFIEEIQYRKNPEYIELIKELDKDPDNKELIERFDQEKKKVKNKE